MRDVLAAETWTAVVIGLSSALIGALALVLSAPLQHLLSRRSLEHKLRSEYEFEQRKELRKLIGRYHGRLVEAADAWGHRMTNLYDHHDAGRMAASGGDGTVDYYFGTTLHRFLTLAALGRQFEAEAFYLDARIAEKADLDFLKYVKAFRWVMTDLDVTQGLQYDPWGGRDHFLTDRYRGLCDAFAPDGELPSLAEFESRVGLDPSLEAAVAFFDGLRADEDRLRWDRLVAHHVLVMSFLNLAGYDMQRSSPEDLVRAVRELRNPLIGANLASALRPLGLEHEVNARRLREALSSRPEVAAITEPLAPAPGSLDPDPRGSALP